MTTDSADLSLEDVATAQQTAHVRLLLFVTGQVHGLLTELRAELDRALRSAAGEGGALDAAALPGLERAADAAWGRFWPRYLAAAERARSEAAAIPWAALALGHAALLPTSDGLPSVPYAPEPLAGAGVVDEAIDPALSAVAAARREILTALAMRQQGGLSYSQRLWRLNREGRAGIRSVLSTGIVDGQDAYTLAGRLERYLGAGAECPRWTRERLRLSKAEIAGGDMSGLLAGTPCGERGVAYAALRLARTEISAALNAASAQASARSPWVEGVAIRLSGSHPKPDECDTHAAGSPYPADDAPLPPYHPNCLCYQVPVLTDPEVFAARAKVWAAGGADAGLDDYARWLGRDRRSLFDPLPALIAAALTAWLTSDPDDMEELRHDL